MIDYLKGFSVLRGRADGFFKARVYCHKCLQMHLILFCEGINARGFQIFRCSITVVEGLLVTRTRD